MLKSDRLYLGHMLEAEEKIVAKTSGIDRTAFDENEDLRLAVAHLIQILGEAARRVPRETQRAHTNFPWRRAIGMRHKIVHDYFAVDDDLVWETATEDVPPLIPLLAGLLELPPPEAGQPLQGV
jgi:uncharacterized protein with HEPN domain